jgi:hypothetical protein
MKFVKSFFFSAAVIAASLFAAPDAAAADVCVVSRQSGYYASLARHIVRWLAQQSVKAEFASKDGLSKSLSNAKIAFLVGYT